MPPAFLRSTLRREEQKPLPGPTACLCVLRIPDVAEESRCRPRQPWRRWEKSKAPGFGRDTVFLTLQFCTSLQTADIPLQHTAGLYRPHSGRHFLWNRRRAKGQVLKLVQATSLAGTLCRRFKLLNSWHAAVFTVQFTLHMGSVTTNSDCSFKRSF